MALKPWFGGREPIGMFDAVDGSLTSFKGGEVVGLQYFSITSNDKHAKDVDDGYVSSTSQTRPGVTKTLTAGMRPLFLCDDGTSGYGTLFGEVVGSSVGQTVTGGTALGPHTSTGSGKVTVWEKPGVYAVTLDAVDTTASTGLVPTNTTIAGGSALYATTGGLLTPNAGAAFEVLKVGSFLEFTTNGSLVTSNVSLVSALNSPSGGGPALKPFTQALFYWGPEF